MQATHVYRPPPQYRTPHVYLHRTVEPYTLRWLFDRATEQYVVLSQPGGGWDEQSIPFGQVPPIVTNDIWVAPLLSPSGYVVTLNSDGIFSIDTEGDTSRQLLTADIYDSSLSQFYGEATFAINDLAPTFLGAPVYVFPEDTPITSANLALFFEDPEDDAVTVTALSAQAGSAVALSTLVPGLTITGATMTGTPTTKAINTVFIRASDPYNATVDGVLTMIVGTITVPNVGLLSSDDAQTALTAVYLNAVVVEDYFEDVPFGQVANQIPAAGTEVNPFTSVTVVLSIGQATISLPSIVGLTQAAATVALAAVGLTAAIETAYSTTVAEGIVISQYPQAGAPVLAAASITVVVSLGLAVQPDNVIAQIRFTASPDVIRFA